MTKNSPDLPNLPNLLIPDFTKDPKSQSGEQVKVSQDSVSFSGNSVEITENSKLAKSDFEQLINSGTLGGPSLLRGALIVFRKEFLAFLRVYFFVSCGFLLVLFPSLLQWGDAIHKSSYKFFNNMHFLQAIGLNSILPLAVLLLFWIFFSWLRAAYLSIASNYFAFDEHFKPLRFGLTKLLSFILIECLQIVMFLIGIALFVIMLPVFIARYSLSHAVMINQNDEAIDSMFESKDYVRRHFWPVLLSNLFITFLIIILLVGSLLLTNLFIENEWIFWSLNFFFFSFLLLPIHGCYRLLLYKRLQKEGELKLKTRALEKIWFVLLRIVFLALLVVNIFLVATGAFGDTLDKIILYAVKLYGGFF